MTAESAGTWPLIVTLLLVPVIICYVHYDIPHFTSGTLKRETTHGALIVTGLALGAVCACVPDLTVPRWFVFATGLGIVHVPAAAILLIKRMRGSGMS